MNVAKPDPGSVALRTMQSLGVASMPRNYEVFYYAMGGGFPEMAKELEALGEAPTQGQIDQVANRYFPERTTDTMVHRAQNKLTQQLDHIKAIADSEAADLNALTRNMSTVTKHLGNDDVTAEKAMEALGVLIAAANLKKKGSEAVALELAEQSIELAQTKKELDEARREALTDPLTGALNRRGFNDRLNAIYDARDSYMYSLVVLDIDHFKKVNDTYGHPVGDKVLQMAVTTIKEHLRNGVQLYRFGGEEFGFVIKGVDSDVLGKIAERVRMAIENMSLRDRKSANTLKITISLGYCMADLAENATELLTKADKALYASKNKGRNRSTNYASLTMESTMASRYELSRQGSNRI